MNRKSIIIIFLLAVFNLQVYSQFLKKKFAVERAIEAPVIDGKLDDAIWITAPIANEFVQYVPYNGEPSKQKTVVKILYDNKAIYVGAMMYDSNPDSISQTLSARDICLDDNADIFVVAFGPYNDGINTNMFMVSAAGVQSDMKTTSGNNDINWDAVWQSEVNIVDSGWIAEIKIPLSELRFSKEKDQTWAFNLYRKITKINEWSSWNLIDIKIEGVANQSGEMSGLKDLKPLLRLSFIPYLSLLTEYNSENESWTRGIRGGLDLKYGITESFTLDMMLIPDFAQVQTDDKILNLSPFEVKYEEHRPFFNEGSELFSKGGIYYSKRVGGLPRNYWDVEDNLTENEIIIENPVENQIINASKLTGRSKKGLGIGFFNAMILKSTAIIRDTLTNTERESVTQPFTNYNLFVFDQSLKNNSHFGIINSNTAMPDNEYYSNVSAIDFNIKNKSQTYQLRGTGGISQIYDKENDNENGFTYDINFEKTAGKFQFGLSNRIIDDKYNPNDLGYLSFNNYIQSDIFIRHKILKPTKRFVEYYTVIDINLMNRYKPMDFMSIEANSETGFTFLNYWTTGFFWGLKPVKPNNFYEPRLENRVYVEPTEYYTGVFLMSDSRKNLFFRLILMHWQSFSDYDQHMKRIEFGPTWRISKRFMLSIGSEYEFVNNSLGYVNDIDDNVYFGKRDRKTFSNEINAEYSFSDKMRLTMRARHYLSSAKYNQYYLLNQDGALSVFPEYAENEDITFNAFNVDMVFNWRFAPGSDLIFVWKNAIYAEDEFVEDRYFENLNKTLKSPMYNHFSIKFLYYLDYNYFKRNR